MPLSTFSAPLPDSATGTWQRLGPLGGDALSMASAGDTVYLGTSDGHIFASENAGRDWTLRGRIAAPNSNIYDAVVQQLLVDSRSPQTVFAGVWFQDTRNGGGIFRSEDGGKTWELAGLKGEVLRTLQQSPAHPETIVAGTRSGVFISTDGHGANWQRISPEEDQELKNIDSIAIDPQNDQTIYVGTYHLPWKTLDAGKHWSAVTSGMIDDSDVMSLRVDATNHARIYASACSGIYRSENGGDAWTKLQGIPYSARRTQSIVQDLADPKTFYAGTTEGLWITRDGGETWARTTPPQWVINAVVILDGGKRVLLGTEAQGALVSEDHGVTFTPANTGFAHHVATAIVSDPGNPRHLLARLPNLDGGILETSDAGSSWALMARPPAERIEKIIPLPDAWLVALAQGGLANISRTQTKWTKAKFYDAVPIRRKRTPARSASPHSTSTRTAPAHSTAKVLPQTVLRTRAIPQVFDAVALGDKLLLATSDGLWTGTPEKLAFTRFVPEHASPAPAFLSLSVRDVDVSPDGKDWLIISDSSLFHSIDAGETWQTFSAPVSAHRLLWIRRATAADAASILIGSENGVFVFRQSESNPWELLRAGLPSTSSAGFAASGDAWVMILSSGLYYSANAGRDWEKIPSGEYSGIFTGVVPDSSGGFFLSSQTEGILHWKK